MAWWNRQGIEQITARKARRKGKWDGRPWKWKFWPFLKKPKPSHPAVDGDYAMYERVIRQAGEDDIQRMAQEWGEEDEELKTEYCEARIGLERARSRFDKEIGEESLAAGAFDIAKTRFLELPAPALDPKWMYFWLVLIGFGEFVFNAQVFLILGQSRFETYLFALALGIILPVGAHYMGEALRQDEKEPKDLAILVATPLVILGALYAVSRFRGEDIASSEIAGILGLHMSADEAVRLFFLINVGLFFVSMLVAYAGGHRDKPEYQRRKKIFKDAKRRLAKESSEAQAAGTVLERAELRYQRAKETRGKRYEHLRQKAIGVIETADWLTSVYESANVEGREDGAVPRCFNRHQENRIQLPEIFESKEVTDWSCDEYLGHRVETADIEGSGEQGLELEEP